MKIEFRKVPLNESELNFSSNSVNFSGTFSKISQKLVDLSGNIHGDCQVECCKCGDEFSIKLDEDIKFLLSDGIYSSDDEADDLIIIEIDDHLIDFDDILNSEVESIRSQYHICENCQKNDTIIDIEY